MGWAGAVILRLAAAGSLPMLKIRRLRSKLPLSPPGSGWEGGSFNFGQLVLTEAEHTFCTKLSLQKVRILKSGIEPLSGKCFCFAGLGIGEHGRCSTRKVTVLPR